MSQAQDARQVPLTQVDRLRQDAEAAAQVRALTTHPDVVALRVERVRSQVDGLIWVGIALGLAFTMVNVQTFAAAGAALGSLAWLAAWVLDPMVSLVLVAVLRAEQVTSRYQVPGMNGWVRVTKVFAFAATYVMNTWVSWESVNASGIVLHSVPPLLVYCGAEAGPILRDRLTEAVLRAARMATSESADTAPVSASTSEPVADPVPSFAPVAVDPTADTIEMPAIRPDHVPAPAPATPARSTRPAPAKRTRSTKASKASKAPAPARSWEQVRAELDAAIEAGRIAPEPTAEEIRRTLRVAPTRARQLRDQLRHTNPGPTNPTPDASEVTRDAA